MAKYLISRTLDPLFALLIGSTAAWNRIRREELSRFHALHSPTSSPLDSAAASGTVSLGPANAYSAGYSFNTNTNASANTNAGKDERGDGKVDADAVPRPPTQMETLRTVRRRLGRVKWDPRSWEWEWRDLWRKRERWGIVDPNG